MSSEEEENFDKDKLKAAIKKLSSLEKLAVIQDITTRIMKANVGVSLTHSKTDGVEHFLCFVLAVDDEEMNDQQNSALFREFSKELSYSHITIYTARSFSAPAFSNGFVPPVLISSDNINEVRAFLQRYIAYMRLNSDEEKNQRSSSSPISFFNELQKERTVNPSSSTPSPMESSHAKRIKHDTDKSSGAYSSGSSGDTSPKKK